MSGKVKGIRIIFCCLDALRNAGIALFYVPPELEKVVLLRGIVFCSNIAVCKSRKLSALAAAASRSPAGKKGVLENCLIKLLLRYCCLT